MSRSSISAGRLRALVVVCLATGLLAAAPSALLAQAGAAAYGTPIHYESENQAAYQAQLKDGEIQSAAFNYVAHHLHLTLKDGRHVYYSYYPAYEPAQVEAQLKAHAIPIAAQHHAAPKPVHHTLRYVLAAVVVVLVLVVLAVLLLGRRRANAAEVSPPPVEGGRPGAAPPPSAE
jgi:hypothetical protein